MYFIYMIRCDDNSLYTGITKDICKRMKEHYYKSKECAKYTRTRDVTSLEALWSTLTRSEACKLEYQIKKLSKKEKEALILNPKQIDDSIYQYQANVSLEKCLNETEIIFK